MLTATADGLMTIQRDLQDRELIAQVLENDWQGASFAEDAFLVRRARTVPVTRSASLIEGDLGR